MAWRTASASFPASWRTTTLLLLYMSKCSVGIFSSTVWALHECLRGERQILKLSLGISLYRKDFCPLSLQSPGTANYSCISFPDTTEMRGEKGSLNQRSPGLAPACASCRSPSQILAMGAVLSSPYRGDAEAHIISIPSLYLMVSHRYPLLGMRSTH